MLYVSVIYILPMENIQLRRAVCDGILSSTGIFIFLDLLTELNSTLLFIGVCCFNVVSMGGRERDGTKMNFFCIMQIFRQWLPFATNSEILRHGLRTEFQWPLILQSKTGYELEYRSIFDFET